VIRRAAPLAAMLLALAPGVARAAVTPGDYGGGAILPGTKVSDPAPGTSFLWARVGADGRARIGGGVAMGCGLSEFDAEVTLAADGSFDATRAYRWRSGAHRYRSLVTVRGRFDGVAASGKLGGTFRHRTPGGRVRRCNTGDWKGWQLRMTPAPAAPAPAQPGATYRGLTSQPGPMPRPFLLRVDRGGGRVVASVFEYARACRAGVFRLNEVSPGADIRPDGTFAIRERFSLRVRGGRERFRLRVDGQFAGGVVSGRIRVRSDVVQRKSGRVGRRCDTGPVTFAASL
jgi:hypothetical protein